VHVAGRNDNILQCTYIASAVVTFVCTKSSTVILLVKTKFLFCIVVDVPDGILKSDLLNAKHVYIMDCYSEVFVW